MPEVTKFQNGANGCIDAGFSDASLDFELGTVLVGVGEALKQEIAWGWSVSVQLAPMGICGLARSFALTYERRYSRF